MTPQEKYIRETNQYDKYVEWLEKMAQISYNITSPSLYNEPEVDERLPLATITQNYIDSFYRQRSYKTFISYEEADLSYQTQIIFPRLLTINEAETVESIIEYWSHIPYVSVEGHYGVEWLRLPKNSAVVINIDFTKSASDDYLGREILEKLAEWMTEGTPIRKDNTRKYDGVVKPLVVRADSV